MIDVKTRRIVTGLKDETGRDVQSEKLLEIDFQGDQPVRAGNQFGIGQVTGSAAAPGERVPAGCP